MSPTPPEEIQRQHEAACRLVNNALSSSSECMKRFNHGEIPLSHKQCPVSSLESCHDRGNDSQRKDKNHDDHDDIIDDEEKKQESDCDQTAAAGSVEHGIANICSNIMNNNNNNNNNNSKLMKQEDVIFLSSRGQVDVSALAALVREGYNEAKESTTSNSKSTNGTSTITKKTSTTSTTKPKNNNNSTTTATTKNTTPASSYSKTNLWNEMNARENNVSVIRPSHDAWGINKIVLIFCDDFCRDVYEMPWWHSRPDIQQAVEPILQCLNLTTTTTTAKQSSSSSSSSSVCTQPQYHRIVRMLLAALPPGVTIPVHHDTGEWVRRTHRVHVPIIVTDPSKVLFQCGLSATQLHRVDCTPGHVFEMNNQAKHAVSNCGTDHRVHLILDYVDEHVTMNNNSGHERIFQRRILLSPGERLVQTRRSMDRLVDRGTRPTPTFMILGAQKAGTTSLYEYMVQHPLVVRAKRRETHCFDWRWEDDNYSTTAIATSTSKSKTKAIAKTTTKTTTKRRTIEEERNHCLQFFHAKELEYHPSCLTGDSTPSYLLDAKRVIPRLKRVFPHSCSSHHASTSTSTSSTLSTTSMKFFVMMRNPTARAYSQYQMVTSTKGTPEQLKNRGFEWRTMTFEQVIAKEIQLLKDCGLIPYWVSTTTEGDEELEEGVLLSETDFVDLAIFESFSGSPEEKEAWDRFMSTIPLSTGSHSLIARGLYELQLRPWLEAFERKQFLLIQLEDMSRSSSSTIGKDDDDDDDNNNGGSGVVSTMNRVWDHLEIPRYPIEDDTPKNTREYNLMPEHVEKYLQRFYAPHNETLKQKHGISW